MELVVIAHNIRSAHNVGSIFRTCEGFGVRELILSGYTPYPVVRHDTRLPHIAAKLTSRISKTSLGAEATQPFRHAHDIMQELALLKTGGYSVVALEQAPGSVPLAEYQPKQKTCLVLGEEVDGVAHEILELCDSIVEIPMAGSKESFNVSVAAGIALYALNLPTAT